MRQFVLAFAAFLFAGTASAQIAQYVPATPDPRHVFVLDSAHLMTPATIASIQATAQRLQTDAHTDLAVVTLPSLGGRSVEEAALYIGRTWGVGSKFGTGVDEHARGMVLLYVLDKTSVAGPNVRVEVGRGLEGTITDAKSRDVLSAMKPHFTQTPKDYDGGFLAGVAEANTLIRASYATAQPLGVRKLAPPAPESSSWVWWLLVPVMALIAIVAGWWFRKAARQAEAEAAAIREQARQARLREATERQEQYNREQIRQAAARQRSSRRHREYDAEPIPDLGGRLPRRVRPVSTADEVAAAALLAEETARLARQRRDEEEESQRRSSSSSSSLSDYSSPASSDFGSSSSSYDSGSSFGGDSGFSGGGSSDSF